MSCLLDTHALLWMLHGDPALSARAREVVLDGDNQLHWSIASLWEVAIKLSIGKLDLAPDWREIISREMRLNGIHWLAIRPEHCAQVAALPFFHRDPFDRLLIAQAQVEGMAVVTADERFSHYEVAIVW